MGIVHREDSAVASFLLLLSQGLIPCFLPEQEAKLFLDHFFADLRNSGEDQLRYLHFLISSRALNHFSGNLLLLPL